MYEILNIKILEKITDIKNKKHILIKTILNNYIIQYSEINLKKNIKIKIKI